MATSYEDFEKGMNERSAPGKAPDAKPTKATSFDSFTQQQAGPAMPKPVMVDKINTAVQQTMATLPAAQPKQSSWEVLAKAPFTPKAVDFTKKEDATPVGKKVATAAFGAGKSVFKLITDKLADTKYFKEAAMGLEAIDAGQVQGTATDFVAEELTKNLSELGAAFSGRGAANVLDTMVAAPINFTTRLIYGKSNPIGDFVGSFAEEMRSQFTTEKSIEMANTPFSMDKIKNPDFWMTTVAENVPVTLAFMRAAAIPYRASTGLATRVLGTSKFAQIAGETAGAITGGTSMRAFESAAEAEEAYKAAKQKGFKEDDAVKAGRDVFVNNMKLVVSDIGQVAIAFAPIKFGGKTTILHTIMAEVAKLGAGAASEGAEEVYQYDIQEDATGNNNNASIIDRFKNDPKAREAGFIGAVMGVAFQAGGRIDEVSKEKMAKMKERYEQDVAANLPPTTPPPAAGVPLSTYLEEVATSNPEAISQAVTAVEEEHQKSVAATRVATETIDSLNIPGIFEQEDGDVLSSIDTAAKEVRGESTPQIDEKVPDDVAETLGALQDSEEAQQDWQENHADDYLKLSDQVSDLQKELKDARKKDVPKLEKQIQELSDQMGTLESDFISKYEAKAKEIVDERAKQSKTEQAIADVEKQVSHSRIMETPEGKETAKELEGASASKVRDYVAEQDRLLDESDGEERQAAVHRGNVARDMLNKFQDENKESVLDVKGKGAMPTAQIEVVEYDDGTFGSRSEYNLADRGGSGPFGTETFPTREAAIKDAADRLRESLKGGLKEKSTAAASKRALAELDKLTGEAENDGHEKGGNSRSRIRPGADSERNAADIKGKGERGGADSERSGDIPSGERGERGAGDGERSVKLVPARLHSDKEPVGESDVPVKTDLAQVYLEYFQAIVDELGPTWEVDKRYTTKTGKLSRKEMFNAGGPAVSGDVSIKIFKVGSEAGIDLQGTGTLNYEQDTIEIKGWNNTANTALMYRATTRDGMSGVNHFTDPTTKTPAEMADAIEDEVAAYEQFLELRTEMKEDVEDHQEALDTSDDEIVEIARKYTRIEGAPGDEYVDIPNHVGQPTEEELEKINTYTGAGGREKEGAEGRGLLDEYYTPEPVAKMVIDALWKLGAFGKSDLKALEPSAGIGAFLSNMPIDVSVRAHEINETAARILKLNYPEVDVRKSPLESTFMDDRGNDVWDGAAIYDIVVGNPPYGMHRGKYKGLGEESGIPRYEEYFIKRSLDLTKHGGYVAMVVPSGFLRGAERTKGKHAIAGLGELVAAYRLPNSTFDTTDIGTDIVIFKRNTTSSFGGDITEIVSDNYFEKHPEHILGEVYDRKGRFGIEQGVKGTVESAQQLFDATRIQEVAEEISEDPDEQEGLVDDIEDSYKPEALKETRKAAPVPAVTKVKKEQNAKAAVTTEKKGKPLKLSQYSKATGAEAKLWESIQPTGELKGNFNKEEAYQYKGEWYNKFNYAQGDVYEKLAQLEVEKETLGAERYAKQKAVLEGIVPTPVPITRMNVSPNSRLVHELKITVDGVSAPLANHFLSWVKKLPHKALGESNTWAIEKYVNGQAVRGGDKVQNEAERRTRRTEGDRLFKLFLSENVPADQQKIVENAYNKQFNSYVRPDYNNVPLTGELNPTFYGKPLEVREVQQQGVGFLVNRGVGLLAHDVGVGKTMQMIIAIHETMSRGWAKKPLIVTPNPNVNRQWVREMSQLLGGVKINLLENLGGDFKGDLATLEVEENSISVITEEGFKRLGFKNETYNELTNDFLDAIENPGESTKRQKELDKSHAEADVAKGIKGTKTERFFEDLGFDLLAVDEVHNANHIIATAKADKKDNKVSEFRGFNVKPSQFGIKTWLAAQYIQKKTGGRNVYLASATPFTNNPLEYYSVLSLMARERMKRMGILNVNDFMTMFMDIRVDLEFKADGSVSEKAEVRGIKNYQQFQKLLTEFIDFRDGEEAGVKRPERVSKEYVVGQTPDQVRFADAAQVLFADTKNAGALKAIGELRAAAFSPFLSRYYSGPIPKPAVLLKESPKLKMMAELIKQSLKDNADGGHLIYSPVGVEFFPIIREALVKYTGLKDSEVQIISGATPKPKRSAIQDAFNAGDVKIVLGSDAIQEGVNLQANTTDIHILSMPWNFTAMKQIIGRAWRQGNKWPRVRVNTYFTENSVDVFLSQKLQNKEARYEATLQFKGDYLDVGDINFEEMKIDLITDPVRRVEMQFDTKEKELKHKMQQNLSEQAYKNRRGAELMEARARVKSYEEYVKDGNSDWAKDSLRRAQADLENVKERLTARGIDVADIEAELAESDKQVAIAKAQIEALQVEKETAITEAKQSKSDMALVAAETDYSHYVQERKAENVDFYDAKLKRPSLTTNLLNKLTGRDKVSKRFISDLTNSPDLKQVERDLIRFVLQESGDVVDVAQFSQRVRSELLPLQRIDAGSADEIFNGTSYEHGYRYENVTLPDELRGQVYNYSEHIYESPIETTASLRHFDDDSQNYFAHARVEDLPRDGYNVPGAINMPVGTTRRIIEIQSDLFQKGGLENESILSVEVSPEDALSGFNTGQPVYKTWSNPMTGNPEVGEKITSADQIDLEGFEEYAVGGTERAADIAKLEPYRNTWWERVIREEARQAAKDGKTKLQFPVGETAMKIEGIGGRDQRFVMDTPTGIRKLREEDLSVGNKITDGAHDWIITEVLEGGIFKANTKVEGRDLVDGKIYLGDVALGYNKIVEGKAYIGSRSETFDISDKTNANNPIFKFYEKDVARYLKNKYGALRVTDAQGVEWMEVTVDPKAATDPVLAFKRAQTREDMWQTVREYMLTEEEKDAITTYRTQIGMGQIPLDETIALVRSAYEKYREYIDGAKKMSVMADRANLPFDLTEEAGEKAMRKMFDEDEVKFLFRQNSTTTANGVDAWGVYQPSRAYSSPMIKIASNEGMVQSSVLYHEAFHAYMDRFVGSTERTEVLGRVKAHLLTQVELAAYRIRGYGTDEVAEEWLADDFARYVASKGHLESNTGFYKKILEKLRTWIRKVTGAQRIYDALLAKERPGARKLSIIEAEREVAQEGDEADDARVRAKLADTGLFGWFRKEREAQQKEILEKIAGLPDNNRDLIRRDINTFENITAQARDIYLKDPNEFEAANAYEKIADQRRIKKAALDQRFSKMLKPYTELKGGSLEKVSNILMQGDVDAKEYTNAELAKMNLNTDEIAGYNAARDAFNTAHRFLIGEMRKNGVPEEEVAEFERERVGYMPHKWRYRYVVKHQVRTKDGTWKTFQMDNMGSKLDGGVLDKATGEKVVPLKSERLARQHWENLKARNVREDVRYTLDTLDNLEVDFFTEQRLSFDAIRSVIVQAKTSQEVQEQMIGALRNMVKEKGFGRNYIRRTGVRGYEKKEVPKITADYFSGMNGFITKMEAAKKYYAVLSTIDARRQSKFYAWMRDMIAYDMGNTKEWQTVKTVAFMWYLANDISFLATNATQNFTVGTGELSKYMQGAQKLAGPEAYIIKAMTDWSIGNVTPEERLTIESLIRVGELGGEMVTELMGFKNNPLYTEISGRFNKVMYTTTAAVEQHVNRVPMFLAARRLFASQGMSEKEANEKALEVSNDVHFRYGKQNRPVFERGRVGTLFVFYHYMRSFLYQLWRDATKGEYAALSRKMFYTAMLGGTLSLPFAKTLISIYSSIFGMSCDLGDEEDCGLAGEIPKWQVALTHGLPALTGVDLSGRVGIDILSINSIMEDPNDIRSYIGAVGALLWVNPSDPDQGGRMQQGIELMRQGRIEDSLGKLLPDMFANPIKAFAGYKWGIRSFAGTPLEDENGDAFKYSTWEAIIRATGFTPTRENLAWAAKSKQFEAQDQQQQERSRIRRTIQNKILQGDYDGARALQQEAIADGSVPEDTNYIREFGKQSFIKDALTEWSTIDHTSENLRRIENDIVRSVYGDEKPTDQQRFNLRKDFAVVRTFGLKNEHVDDLQSAGNIEDRVEILIEMRRTLSEEAFMSFLQDARKTIRTEKGNESHILISDDLLEAYKKAKAKRDI